MRNPNWTREELILAFNLYFKIPYGQFNPRSKGVIELSGILGRSPGAVAYKLVNFVSLDPAHKEKGRKGAVNVGKLDIEVFNEFRNNWEDLLFESERVLAEKQNFTIEEKYKDIFETTKDKQGEERVRLVKTRVNQDLFRKIILTNFDYKCAITSISIPELLIASHIKPWSKDKNERLNPSNGISLSATFDKAFDKGLITIDDNFRVIASSYVKKYAKNQFYKDIFEPYENKEILLPRKVSIGLDFIKYHNDNIFLGK
jgi:putative restriction endonuclease